MSSGAGQGVKPGKRNDVYNSEFRALPFSIRRNNFNSYLMDNYWHSVEEDWRNSNLATLTPLLNITCKVHQFVADVATSSEITQAKPSARLTVERLLLRRLGEELRAVEILAERGHGLQAISSTANIFEQSKFLNYISADEKRATDFLQWSHNGFMVKIVELNKIVGKLLSWETNRIEEDYRKYRLLCGFKHNNPMFMRVLLLPVDPDQYLARLALADSNWFILISVSLLALQRFSDQRLMIAIDKCNLLLEAIESEIQELPTIKS